MDDKKRAIVRGLTGCGMPCPLVAALPPAARRCPASQAFPPIAPCPPPLPGFRRREGAKQASLTVEQIWGGAASALENIYDELRKRLAQVTLLSLRCCHCPAPPPASRTAMLAR